MRCNDISMNAPRFESNSGSEVKPVYHTKVDGKGNIELEIIGYENIQDKIEAERPGTELSVLIARYENGDLLALDSKKGFYGDVTKFPGNLIDAMNLVADAEKEFEKLPVDIKQTFGSDWRKWLALFGTDDWNKAMKPVFVPDIKEEVSDVKESEE